MALSSQVEYVRYRYERYVEVREGGRQCVCVREREREKEGSTNHVNETPPPLIRWQVGSIKRLFFCYTTWYSQPVQSDVCSFRVFFSSTVSLRRRSILGEREGRRGFRRLRVFQMF